MGGHPRGVTREVHGLASSGSPRSEIIRDVPAVPAVNVDIIRVSSRRDRARNRIRDHASFYRGMSLNNKVVNAAERRRL